MLPRVIATRYVTPLREGGSLPGLMEADDLGLYVVKFRGAGQGLRTLVAEVIAAGLARTLALPVPDLVAIEVGADFAPAEPDEEIQDLLRRSVGLNLCIDFLPGSLDFDPAAFPVDPQLAGRVLWFDALIANVDRTVRNPNLLQWHGLRCIDHGATLAFHHRWETADAFAGRPYDAGMHVLLEAAPDLAAADRDLAPLLTPEHIAAAVAAVPVDWLPDDPAIGDAAAQRDAYVRILGARLAARDAWLPGVEAQVRAGRPPAPPARERMAFLRDGD